MHTVVQLYLLCVCVSFKIKKNFFAAVKKLFHNAAVELETKINRLVYSKTPVSLVEDQDRFTKVMAAFHHYEITVSYLHILVIEYEDNINGDNG